jgi:transcription initiation factor TFIIH subunit 2
MTYFGFDRLIRFEAADGQTYYGNLERELPTREMEGATVEVLEGDIKTGFKGLGTRAKVTKVHDSPPASLLTTNPTNLSTQLLSPLEHVPIILCIGLNYRKHAEETKVHLSPP